MWGLVTHPTARGLASSFCALWGRHEGARGGRLWPGCGASEDGSSPTPDHWSFRACGRGRLPAGCGCRGCGRGDPSPTPQRALLRAGFARSGGGMRVPRGGRLLPEFGPSGVGRSPTPDHSPFRSCGRGPLPTGCGCGGCGRGDPLPTPQRALLRAGFARCGGGMRVPGGGASCLGAGRPWSGALPPPTTHSFGHAAGAHHPLAVGAGDAGAGTRHLPHGACSCELALHGVGATSGCPGGAPPAWVQSVRALALSQPRPLVLSGMRPGLTSHWLWVRGVRVSGPVTNPTARPLASWLCALLRRHEGGRGGGLLPQSGGSGVGRSPNPDHSSFRACGRGPLPTGSGWGGCGRGDPTPTPQRALLRAGFARPGGGMRVPGGGASCLGVGVRDSGALPTPTTRPFGRAAGAHYPLAVGGGGAGVGIRHQPHSARSCEVALRALGAARGCPGGGASCLRVGVRGRTLSHPRPLVLSGVRPEPTTHWLLVPGVRAWGPVTNPTARALASWLCALRGHHEGARGGRLLPGCGASRVGRSPTPDHSSFLACGWGPLPTGCGCRRVRRGDPSPTPQRALLRAGFARCGGGMRLPRGGPLLLGGGRPGSGALPPPTTRPFGRAAGAHHPLAVGAGGAGVGTRHQPHSARSCEVALRAVGAA